jgi:hypothetical protein
MKKMWILVIGMALLAGTAQAELVVNSLSYSYSQDFDTLANSGSGNTWIDDSTIAGWWWDSSAPAEEPSTAANGYDTSTGSSAAIAAYSFGASGNGERAMGMISGGSRPAADFAIAVQFRNNTGSAISLADVKVSYTGEQWRRNTPIQNNEFAYTLSTTLVNPSLPSLATFTDVNALDFAAPQSGTEIALDGNDVANRTTFSNIALNTTGSWASGDYLMLRWMKAGTTAPALAVDDFSISIIPEPASFGLLALGALGVRLIRRRRM